eukprot:3932103-Rhodomonas_salina.1
MPQKVAVREIFLGRYVDEDQSCRSLCLGGCRNAVTCAGGPSELNAELSFVGRVFNSTHSLQMDLRCSKCATPGTRADASGRRLALQGFRISST